MGVGVAVGDGVGGVVVGLQIHVSGDKLGLWFMVDNKCVGADMGVIVGE